VLRRLAAAWQPGDEAVVPSHDDCIEPLAALYARGAVLRKGFALRRGNGAMHELVERLTTRLVPCDARYFYNINRPHDLAGVASAR
jgi:molybdopterin-guanine dinucleotide biosynthesis protein A